MTRFYNSPETMRLPQLTPGRNLTERLVYILQRYKTFKAASSNVLRSEVGKETLVDAPNWGSFEDIHNAVHVLMGGGGNMAQVEVSAFDPIFWLRKCYSIQRIKTHSNQTRSRVSIIELMNGNHLQTNIS